VVALNTLAWRYITGVGTGLSADPKADIQRGADLVARALALEPDSYWAHHVKSQLLLVQKRPDEALVEAKRSRALNPSFIDAYADECFAYWGLGQPEKTIEVADTALRLSPRDPLLFIFYFAKGLAYAMLNESTKAIEMNRRASAMAPQFSAALRDLASDLALDGQLQEARAALQRYLSLPDVRIRTVAQEEAHASSLSDDNHVFRAWLQRYLEGLRKAGLPEQ
jgi:adenylate cyclase